MFSGLVGDTLGLCCERLLGGFRVVLWAARAFILALALGFYVSFMLVLCGFYLLSSETILSDSCA